MPRNGSGVASLPTSTAAVSGDTISSTKYNAVLADFINMFNSPWPLAISQNLAALGGQPLNANLTSISSLGTAADKVAYTTAAGTWAETAFPAWARAFNGAADVSAARTALGAQTADAALTSIAGLTYSQGDLLYTTAADTFARLPKGTALQVLRMNSGATAPEWASPVLSKEYTSAETAVAAIITVSHGLGVVPKMVSVVARCKTAEYGYSVGDEVELLTDQSVSIVISVVKNASTITVVNATLIYLPDKSTGSSAGYITASNWRIVVSAYA